MKVSHIIGEFKFGDEIIKSGDVKIEIVSSLKPIYSLKEDYAKYGWMFTDVERNPEMFDVVHVENDIRIEGRANFLLKYTNIVGRETQVELINEDKKITFTGIITGWQKDEYGYWYDFCAISNGGETLMQLEKI